MADEPPLLLRPGDLVRAGRRRRRQCWTLGGAAGLAAAGVAAVLLLASTAGPAAPVYQQPPVIVRPPVSLAPSIEDPSPAGPVDLLTPAQETELVRQNGATFRRAYRPPVGWTIRNWVAFVDDPGISDAYWSGGAVLTDGAGRVATVLVALSVQDPVHGGPSCPGGEGCRCPAGAWGT